MVLEGRHVVEGAHDVVSRKMIESDGQLRVLHVTWGTIISSVHYGRTNIQRPMLISRLSKNLGKNFIFIFLAKIKIVISPRERIIA